MSMFEINDLEAYFAWEADQQERVRAALTVEQRSISWGDTFFRIWQMPMEPEPIIIFGRVYTLDELRRTEDEDTIARLVERFPYFCFTMCYSVVEPEGEPGDTNRYNMWPITKWQFAIAEQGRWDPHDPAVWPWLYVAGRDYLAKRKQFTDVPFPGKKVEE
jgi:hypothetical protein